MTTLRENCIPTAGGWSTAAWIAFATLISFVFSGYIPLSSNNIYHLPILFGAYDLPQFQSDTFIQSLRNFSSGFWIVFADTSWLAEPKLFLGVWLVITHFAFLGACVHFAHSLGYRDPAALSAFPMVLALASLSIGEAAGGGGLLVESFTHSELANASMLMVFSFSLSKRYGYAFFFGCLTFFLNAFMAVWATGPALALAAYHVGSGQLSLRALVRQALSGSIGLALLIPVLASIFGNNEGLAATSFSYSEYLRDFFPAHFFIATVGTMAFVEGAALVAVLLLTFGAHNRARAGLLALGIGAVAVLLLGTIVPLLTDSRSILNLHLIRSFVMLHLMAELSMVLFALKRIWSPDARNDAAIGAVTAALLFLPRPFWIVVIFVLLFDRLGGREWQLPQRHQGCTKIFLLLLLSACVAALPFRAYRKFQYTQTVSNDLAQWEVLGTWAKRNTSPSARFLIAQHEDPHAVLGFSYTAFRQVWTDYKYGAAVMWSPSYYQIWKARQDAVKLLSDLKSMRAYAKTKSIDYIASRCMPHATEVFRYERACVYEGAVTSK